MTARRTYGDPCGIARALDAVGERWALLIVRELLYGPKRFTDLRDGLGDVSPNVLSQRLRELERAGILRKLSDGGSRYALTDWGRDLAPIVVELGRWGARSPAPPSGELSVDALMVALESTFVADEAGDLDATFELRLDDATFTLEVDRGHLHLVRGPARRPAATITTDPSTLRAVVFGDTPFDDAGIGIDGDRPAASRLLHLFRRPTPVPRPSAGATPAGYS